MSTCRMDAAAATYATAHEHPATHRTSRRDVLVNSALSGVLSLLAVAAFCGLGALPGSILSWGFPALWMVSMALSLCFARAAVSTRSALLRRRILRTYPWQQMSAAVQRDAAGPHKLALPHPDAPGKEIQLLLPSALPDAIPDASPDEVWFAGDPRYMGVVALPGPRRMATVLPPAALDRGIPAYSGPLSEEARRRALAVGARVRVPDDTLERGPLPVHGGEKVAMHHPETAVGFRRTLLRRRCALYGQLGALAVFFSAIGLVDDPDPLVPAAGMLMVLSPFTVLSAAVAVGGARRLGQTLRTYPWQECAGEPDNRLSLVILRPAKGHEVRLKSLPLRKAFPNADRYWFAGDLRYGGAVSEAGGNRPTRVVHTHPKKAAAKKAAKNRRTTPANDALDTLAEQSGLTKGGRPKTWAY
ncbi:hypothetical protein [Streptomyces sp. NPDC017993]|uniref:hypothetical protein n=1 Tax=Streptomyces sp. NPDC017993 TaxID=3365027 RepID=UPI0037B5E9C0